MRKTANGRIVSTIRDSQGRTIGKVLPRTNEQYQGYVLSFRELVYNGQRRTRGVAVRGNDQIFIWGRTKQEAEDKLKSQIRMR